MSAIFRLSGSLKDVVGGKDEYIVEPGQTVREQLLALGIVPETVAMVSVNGVMETKDYVIQDGDTVRVLAVVGGG